MPAAIRRILTHAALTAASLAAVGLMLAYIATIALDSLAIGDMTGAPAATASSESMANGLYWQLPLRLAAMGFVIVVAGEGLAHIFRRRRNSHAT